MEICRGLFNAIPSNRPHGGNGLPCDCTRIERVGVATAGVTVSVVMFCLSLSIVDQAFKLLRNDGTRILEMKVCKCLSVCKRKSGTRYEGSVFNGNHQSCWQIRMLDDRGDEIWVGSKKVSVPKSNVGNRSPEV